MKRDRPPTSFAFLLLLFCVILATAEDAIPPYEVAFTNDMHAAHDGVYDRLRHASPRFLAYLYLCPQGVPGPMGIVGHLDGANEWFPAMVDSGRVTRVSGCNVSNAIDQVMLRLSKHKVYDRALPHGMPGMPGSPGRDVARRIVYRVCFPEKRLPECPFIDELYETILGHLQHAVSIGMCPAKLEGPNGLPGEDPFYLRDDMVDKFKELVCTPRLETQ